MITRLHQSPQRRTCRPAPFDFDPHPPLFPTYSSTSDLDLALVGAIHVRDLKPRQLHDIEKGGHKIRGEYVPLVSYLEGSESGGGGTWKDSKLTPIAHVSHSFSLFLAPPSHQGALDKGSKGDLLRRCADLLKRYRVTLHHSIQYILHARVPIITFKDSMHREIYQGLP